jgi:serine/threonine-protein kinase RsbW
MVSMTNHTGSKAFKSETAQLKKVRAFVESGARAFGFQESDVANIILAVDEACTNIIKHAYEGASNGDIIIEVSTKDNAFVIRIRDDGKAFDPDGVEPPNLRKQISEYRRGGLGVYLMKRLMDKVEYAIHPGKQNVVTLIKHRSEAV